ncbi:hypothetical protein TNCV_1007201 [Trichonephila clavipes]|nr:hypothetical protein TNCV_1007201 [Trichonephila clavipes]
MTNEDVSGDIYVRWDTHLTRVCFTNLQLGCNFISQHLAVNSDKILGPLVLSFLSLIPRLIFQENNTWQRNSTNPYYLSSCLSNTSLAGVITGSLSNTARLGSSEQDSLDRADLTRLLEHKAAGGHALIRRVKDQQG